MDRISGMEEKIAVGIGLMEHVPLKYQEQEVFLHGVWMELKRRYGKYGNVSGRLGEMRIESLGVDGGSAVVLITEQVNVWNVKLDVYGHSLPSFDIRGMVSGEKDFGELDRSVMDWILAMLGKGEKVVALSGNSKPLSRSRVEELARKYIRWFDKDGELSWSTREHGDVGAEKPGREDLDASYRFGDEVKKEFPGHEVVFGGSEEWVNVTVKPAHGTRVEAKTKEGGYMNRMMVARELLAVAKELEAVKFDTRKELQKYKTEHHPTPGTKLELRNEQEMKKRYQERK